MMNNEPNKPRPNGRGDAYKSALARYAALVGILVGAFLLLGGAGLLVYMAAAPGGGNFAFLLNPAATNAPAGASNGGVFEGGPDDLPERTTLLVMGVNDGLSDTMLLVSYDAADGHADVISIPRDTKITLPQEDVERLRALGRLNTPVSGKMKLNELNAYAGTEYGPMYVRDFIEGYLGVKIDYHVIVSLKAFRDIVDIIGGVEVTVPPGGFHNKDPENYLGIDLDEGTRVLNGEQAEQFVRFREGYAEGDLGRVAAQQTFIKALISQALSKESIRQNWAGFASTVISYVKTDIGLDDIPKYLPAIESFNPADLRFHTLPGEAEHSDRWYFIYDEAAGAAMLAEVLSSAVKAADAGEAVIDKTLNIEVLNGTTVNGLAGRTAERLKADGYNVSETGTYTGTSRTATRIMCRDMALGRQFLPYFGNAVIETDAGVPKPFDVVIILGTSEG